jgi:hypothetical protein
MTNNLFRGGQLPGEDHPSSKLKNKTIKNLKILYCSGLYTRKELAEMFKIDLKYLHNIIQGYSWGKIKPTPEELKGMPRKLGSRKLKEILPGDKINHWTVIGPLVAHGLKHCYIVCECDCGAISYICASKLRTGIAKFCRQCSAKNAHEAFCSQRKQKVLENLKPLS